jgi:hypothetical protein
MANDSVMVSKTALTSSSQSCRGCDELDNGCFDDVSGIPNSLYRDLPPNDMRGCSLFFFFKYDYMSSTSLNKAPIIRYVSGAAATRKY